MSKQLSGVIFDLDGTLVDSAPDICNAINAHLATLQRRALTLEEVKAAVGDGAMLLVERALALTGQRPTHDGLVDHVQDFIRIYRNIAADPTQIYPGVTATLEDLTARDVALGICTNKPEVATHKLLDDLRLKHYFHGIAGGDTFQVHKPNPDHLRGVIAMMGVAVAESVMVGDSPNDLAAAQGLGIPCIMVDYGYGSGVRDLPADAVISDLTALRPTLMRLGFFAGE